MDLSKGPGIIPVKIQDSYIISKYFNYIHSINLTTLQFELTNALITLDSLNEDRKPKTSYNESLRAQRTQAQLEILKTHIAYAQDKLDHILLNSQSKRPKRGLINALGTAISWLTGNMDADDKAHYDSIIRKIESNNRHVEHNVVKQTVINKRMIDEFNQDINTIKNNNLRIRKFLNTDVSNIIEMNQNFMLLYSNIILLTNKINDIDTSIEFCKLNIIHNSVISKKELYSLHQHNKIRLISEEPEILWQTGKLHCSLTQTHLHYLIQLPIQSPLVETYFLLSYPYENNGQILTTTSQHPLILKTNIILAGTCNKIINNYYCLDVKEIKNNCITNLLMYNHNEYCNTYNITTPKSFIQYVDIINKYLVFKTSLVTIQRNNISSSVHTRDTSLLTLETKETIQDLPPVYHYMETEPVPILKLSSSVSPLNITFEALHKLNIEFTPLEILQEVNDLTDTDHTWVLYSLIILLFTLLGALFVYQLRAPLKKHFVSRPPHLETDTNDESNEHVHGIPLASFILPRHI